ncbi:hypothetical protein [Pseudonocardia sp. NPDC049154]|uniref:hypothetical protein n=1 Tax=Pseudonocardia sp. NPDC049154 TaxID=3155501 RepID=UPI00340BF5CD
MAIATTASTRISAMLVFATHSRSRLKPAETASGSRTAQPSANDRVCCRTATGTQYLTGDRNKLF